MDGEKYRIIDCMTSPDYDRLLGNLIEAVKTTVELESTRTFTVFTFILGFCSTMLFFGFTTDYFKAVNSNPFLLLILSAVLIVVLVSSGLVFSDYWKLKKLLYSLLIAKVYPTRWQVYLPKFEELPSIKLTDIQVKPKKE